MFCCFLRKFAFCFATLLSKCCALLAFRSCHFYIDYFINCAVVMQSTLENNRTKFRIKISSEFWEIAVFVGDVFAAVIDRFCRAMLCISAAYAVMRCLSVCLSVCVCLSRSWIMSKRINISSKCFNRRENYSSFSVSNGMAICRLEPP